jgi:hypothetical protein
MREWRYNSTILDFDTRWRWVASFPPRPLYSRGKSPRYHLDRRLDGPQSRSERCGVEKHHLPRNRTPAVQAVARHYIGSPSDAHYIHYFSLITRRDRPALYTILYLRFCILNKLQVPLICGEHRRVDVHISSSYSKSLPGNRFFWLRGFEISLNPSQQILT